MRGLVAAVFLGLAILFLGIASMTGAASAWLMAAMNGCLFVLNLVVAMNHEKKPPTPGKDGPAVNGAGRVVKGE